MKKNNFLKYGKVFLSSVFVSIYSLTGGVSYGDNLQENNQTTMIFSVKNDNQSLKNKIKSIENNKNNIKNNLKIYSKSAVAKNSIDEKKLEETSDSVKKNKSFPQKMFRAFKYLISSAVFGVGYMLKGKFLPKKEKRKYEEINQQQLENQDPRTKKLGKGFINSSSFHHAPDDDDDDDKKTPKFYPTTTTGPKNPSSELKKYETKITTKDGELDDIDSQDEDAPPVGIEDMNAPDGPKD